MPDRLFEKYHIDPSHFFFHPKVKLSEHAALYLTNTLRTTALGLIGIFLPIYIFSLADTYLIFTGNELINNFTWVLSYYLLSSFGALIFIFAFSRMLFRKLHLNIAIFLSLIILAIEVGIWILAANNLYLIWIAGLLGGFRKVFYWIPYHIFFEKNFSKNTIHFGKSTAKRQFLVRVVAGITPAIGGIVVATLGFKVLFSFSIGLLLLAGLPVVFMVKDWKHNDHRPIEVFKKIVLNKKYKMISLAHFGQGLEVLIMTSFWPLFLFFILANFEKIGFLNSISYVAAALATLLVGKIIDKKGPKLTYALGVIVNSVLYVFKVYIKTPLSAYIMDIVDRTNSPLYGVPSMSVAYEKAEKIGRSDYHIFREIVLNSGRVVGVIIALGLIYSPIGWRNVFLVAMVGGILSYFINFDKR